MRPPALLASLALLLLAGCNSGTLGPARVEPVLSAPDVRASTTNTRLVLTALAEDNQIYIGDGSGWYDVAEAGFNYIDDRCSVYFDKLFRLNRQRDAAKSLLTATDKTSSAILTATQASTLTMGVVAQAFGLALATTDIVAGTYLYQLPPATTLGFVKEVQKAYRDGAVLQRRTIMTPSAAYHLIQGYLSLCLPPTIESMLVEHINGAHAEPNVTGGSVSVVVGTSSSPAEMRVLAAPNVRLAPIAPIPPDMQGLTRVQVIGVQERLCVSADGRLGTETVQALVDFYRGYKSADRSDLLTTGRLTGVDRGDLAKLIAVEAKCPHGNVTSAELVGRELKNLEQ